MTAQLQDDTTLTSETADASPEEVSESPPVDERIVEVTVAASEDRKAEGIKVLDLAAISDFTDRFVICSGTNERQVEAIADLILERTRAEGYRPLHVEGQGVGRWILIDFGGEMVVHVFLDETRNLYALERLWSDAPDMTAQFVSPEPA